MEKIIAFDVGTKRIGVAICDGRIKLASKLITIEVDGNELKTIRTIIEEKSPDVLLVGFPRNQSGEVTKQTATVEGFARRLEVFDLPVVFQDESLTSVVAEEYLKKQSKPYTKDEIDSMSATLILQDYLEEKYGRY